MAQMTEPVDRDALRCRELASVATKPLAHLLQLDGFRNVKPDSVMYPDDDGDDLFQSWTWELRRTASPDGVAVRVSIAEGTLRKDAVRLTRKLLAWLEEDGDRDTPIVEEPGYFTGDDLPF